MNFKSGKINLILNSQILLILEIFNLYLIQFKIKINLFKFIYTLKQLYITLKLVIRVLLSFKYFRVFPILLSLFQPFLFS